MITQSNMVQETKKPGNLLLKKILITAGPTIEPLDPVRYITNHSSGNMGCKIAEQAVKAGYTVSVISGPVNLSYPEGVEIINVSTAREMKKEVEKRVKEYDCIVMAAAVCDFRPAKEETQKIKKNETHKVELIKNPDILTGLKDNKDIKKIGFALETQNAFQNGKRKLEEKGLDIIVINEKTDKNDPFGGEAVPRDYTIIDKKGDSMRFENIEKDKMAQVIVERIGKLI